MTAKILDGDSIAGSIRAKLKTEVESWRMEGRRLPGLAVVLLGNEPSSELYVRLKHRDCQDVGVPCSVFRRPHDTSEAELLHIVEDLNADPTVDGILIQLPLPSHIDVPKITARIEPRKDVDGISPYNMGMLTLRQPGHRSCTSKGVMTLLRHVGVSLFGLHAIVIGASNHVGRPMGLELLLAGCTVTTAHKFSRDTHLMVRESDIVISATGKPKLVKKSWIKPGAIVIDIGIETQDDGSLIGDVDFDEVRQIASWITPVPGGVGPMTRVSILENLMDSARNVA